MLSLANVEDQIYTWVNLQTLKLSCVLVCAWAAVTCLQPVHADEPARLIDRLRQTHAVNIETIIDGQFGQTETPRGFRVADPYRSEVDETVQLWSRDPARAGEVCAIRFVDAGKVQYELHGFDSPAEATEAGFIVSHQGRCGSCSTLQDLASYLASPDLTTPARRCARKSSLKRKKRCLQESIGLTPHCAESWAYNTRNTRKECRKVCSADYGLVNLIFNRYPGPSVLETGHLRPCLQCDEDKSGAGFKYSAGRTRRNSGIKSAIWRLQSENYPVDHSAYFD